nr:sigma-70 family RNA polymerase sigma factor [Streptomyces sp. DSM 41633]
LGLSERDADVEALVQDTFEEALRVWDTIRIPRAWLYTVARRRLSRCVPAAMRRAHGAPSDHAEQPGFSWTTLTPVTTASDFIAAREITALIQQMPQQRRQEVAYLRYLEEWDFNEIAEQLGCCPATARVHALNARIDFVNNVHQPATPPPSVMGKAGGFSARLLVLLVVGCTIAAAILFGWPWALVVAVGGVAIILVSWAASTIRMRLRRTRRRTLRR